MLFEPNNLYDQSTELKEVALASNSTELLKICVFMGYSLLFLSTFDLLILLSLKYSLAHKSLKKYLVIQVE
jgi:hypothetical protein